MKVDPRFLTSDGPEVFTGNELLVKGCLETEGGVHLLGGYPGSPVAGFFDTISQIKDLLNAHGVHAVINNNEALAAAMLNGSQTLPVRAIITMKSVGVHVAADALALANLAGAHPEGGAIVVYGDDPWSDATQVPVDSRYISKHLHIPTIEPSTPQEAKDFIDLSFKISGYSELLMGYILTTNLADGGGTVQCKPNQFPRLNTRQKFQLETAAINTDKRVLLPPKTWWQEETLSDRHGRAIAKARQLGINRFDNPTPAGAKRKPLGFVTSGLAWAYLKQALTELGLWGEFPVLKFGLSYPTDADMVAELSGMCERIVVVEERRDFLEEQVRQAVLSNQQAGNGEPVELWGKKFPFGLQGLPETRGLHPSIILDRLTRLLDRLAQAEPVTPPEGAVERLHRERNTLEATERTDVGKLPVRLPTFCPGCPHRDSSDVCLEIKRDFMDATYMRCEHGREPVDLLFHGDIGCYTMLMFPPNTPLMMDLSGMGLGGSTGTGNDPFLTNKEVVFMGDSTFFHSGQLAISQAVKLRQDITFIILDNSTTAMTGHQPTPGVDYDVLGNVTPKQDIEQVVRGIVGEKGMFVGRFDPERRKDYRKLLERLFLADGVKVVIATKECGITEGRRRRRLERAIRREKGFLPSWTHMNVNQDVCRFCLACSEMTACPGLKHVETDYGRKMDTDLSWCVRDGACERIGACSSFEEVVIKRKRPPRSKLPELELDQLPEPTPPTVEDAWRVCLTGVGGMGIGVATQIIVRAGHKEGYNVIFLDKKGLAIRNGGVVSQVVYSRKPDPATAIIPYGKADLIVGVDILEAARTLDPTGRSRIADKSRTAAVLNTDKIQTVAGIMGKEDFEPGELVELIRRYTREDDFLAKNISRICERYLGGKLYANIMMLGFAFQKGLIPVSMHSMAWAIKDTIRADFKTNLYAFNMGRKLVENQDLFQGPPMRTAWQAVLDDKCRYVIRRIGRTQKIIDGLREIASELANALEPLGADAQKQAVIRTYDCLRWGGLKYARRYADRLLELVAKDVPEHDYAITRAAVHNLANAMLIKDVVYIAELASSPEKYARDREKYNVNPANGDRIRYTHYFHETIPLGRFELHLDRPMKPWMLKILKRMKWLRKLPGWYAQKRSFLTGYEKRLDQFAPGTPDDYARQLRMLSSPGCLNCMNAVCREEKGCPLGNDIPKWLQMVYQNRWQEAAAKLHERNNFPEFTSRICPGFCEQACKQGINDYPVRIQEIERQIIDRAFEENWIAPHVPAEKTGKTVAVVGSGPAGLAAAQQLARQGHSVTVFERDGQPGGLLRYGIPAWRLEKDLIDRRLTQLHGEGIQFRTGCEVGKDISADQLRAEFDAIVLAVGAHQPRDLSVPGRSSEGIYFALDYLRQANEPSPSRKPIDVAGKSVAVIGGGLTGEDCLETALAQGAREVTQLEILPETQAETLPVPDDPDADTAPNVQRRWCVATKAFEGNGKGVTGLRAVRVEWQPSANGPVMRELDDTEFRVASDVVMLAMGFEPQVPAPLAEQLGLATADSGQPVIRDFATSVEGIYAAGDIVAGASYVATAIDSGRRAAVKVDEFLRRPAPLGSPELAESAQ